MSDATPRINARYLEQFAHHTVRIVGTVTQIRGETATLDAQGSVTLHLNPDCHLQPQHACEIIGRVQNDLSVRVLASTDWGVGQEIDLAAVDAVVDATHRYHEIFYPRDP